MLTQINLRSRPRLVALALLIRALVRFRAFRALTALATRFVTGAKTSDAGQQRVTALVLKAHSFRGDLAMYEGHSDIRFLILNWEFLRALVLSFVDQCWMEEPDMFRRVTDSPQLVFHSAEENSKIGRQRKRYREFLRAFLPMFLERLGVDIVITHDLRFRRQADFCRVASELGYPHLVFQRESMFTVKSVFDLVAKRHSFAGRFRGDAIIVQNEVTKSMFLSSGICDETKISVIGCPRMDDFARRLSAAPENDPVPTIALFAWPDHVAGEFLDIREAVAPTVRAAARVARADPQIQLRIKLKDYTQAERQQKRRAEYEQAIREICDEIPPNITFVVARMGAHDLILSSTIVIAMQSTVVLEAAVADKPVILPHFSFLTGRPGAESYLMYMDQHELFDVPEDEEDLERLIRHRLSDPNIPEAVARRRHQLFSDLVSPLEGSATQRGVAIMSDWASVGRDQRRTHSVN